MKYLVLGDSHGNWYDINVIISQAIKKYKIDACIQVGDFGFYPMYFENNRYLKFPIPVYAIDGNHENHEFIKKSISNGTIKSWKDDYNIEYVPRGTVWQIEDMKIGFMGGAMNVDSSQKGSSKKRTTNYPLNVEIREAIKTFNEVGKLDIMFTHSCPHSIGVGMQGSSYFLESIQKHIEIPFGISTGPLQDCGEQSLKNLWDGLVEKPTNWVFGHFHTLKNSKVDNTWFTCVGVVDSYFNKRGVVLPFILDTKNKSFECFPKDTLLNSEHFHRTRILEKNDYPI